MEIVGVDVIAEGSGTAGYTVEFVEGGGSVISVRLDSSLGDVNRTNAVRKAKQLLETLICDNSLPDEIVEGKNQHGRGATTASSFDTGSRTG